MEKILIIEDEKDIQELLCVYLQDAGYQVHAEGDGVLGWGAFNSGDWDLVLLDLMLPKIDGYGVCELIRSQSDVPVIMLTALEAEENQLRGYELRIDDYVTKPFSMPVLLKKIAAVLRRYGGDSSGEKIKYRDIAMDLESYQVTVDTEPIELTNREFEILREFLQRPGRVLTREMLLERVWDYDYLGDERIVDSHIKNLRKKLNRDYIETVRGVGYRAANP